MTKSMNLPRTTRHLASSLHLAVAIFSLLSLAACASVPEPPTAALLAAEQAIAAAERDDVTEYATPEITEARSKLNAAHSAVQQEEMVQAERLAHESRADAELASAKAEAGKAKVVNDEMQKSIDTLKQEMQRNSGGSK